MKRIYSAFPIALVALALAVPAAGAGGDKPRPGAAPADLNTPAEQRKKALEDKLEKKREEAAERRDSRREALEERRDEKADARDDKKDELRERWQKLRETRKERRKEHREKIKQAWGDLYKRPAVKAELKVHAWRMARLHRLRAIAESRGKTETMARIDKLIEKEKQRHQRHMDGLKSKGGEP
jgi:hypothetical protein